MAEINAENNVTKEGRCRCFIEASPLVDERQQIAFRAQLHDDEHPLVALITAKHADDVSVMAQLRDLLHFGDD